MKTVNESERTKVLMDANQEISRRGFLETAGLGAAGLIAAPAVLRGAAPTSDPVRVGHIGTGTRGWDLVKYTGATDSAKVVAVCDVYKPHLERGVKAANQPDVYEKQGCTVTFEGVQNSHREQTPEFCGREARMVFNAIGQSANRFEVYPDGPAWTMGNRPREPLLRYAATKADRWPNHMENFLNCVRTGEPPRCNVDEAFIEAATLLLSVESYRQKRQVRWDPQKEEIV